MSYARRTLATLFVLAVIGIPFALINSGFGAIGTGTDETLHTLLRMSALLAISFLFLQIATGAFRPALRRLFSLRALQGAHTSFGIVGLVFVFAHFFLLTPSVAEHWSMLNHGFFVLGPIMLFFLLITISTALALRKKLPRLWNQLHLLNYSIFVIAVVHSLGIGTQTSLAAARAIWAAYLLIAVAGFAYRASSPEWRRRRSLSWVRVRAD
ncbi:MAG: hypothetical protein M1274_02180 [Actinobacteria bacterium]|nr:hypothetical protein [Actinomycetota bacterium]